MSSRINFTKAALDTLPLPAPGQRATYHDHGGPQSVPGLQIRITSNGVRTFCVFKRVAGGQPERITLGRYPEISIDQARKAAKAHIAKLAQGESPNESRRADRAASMTLAEAIKEYVEKKRRRDGLPLKQRTIDDYLGMVAPGHDKLDGTHTLPGHLYALANKPIRTITAADIRRNHEANLKRGERQAAYGAQVLRAVLAWHGVTVPHSPFSREVPGRDRIIIPAPRATGEVLPPELIGPFWRGLNEAETADVADYLKFLLLTGCRPAEPLSVRVGDCDLAGGRVLLKDTKNRKDHTILLSRQALEIVQRQADGKTANAKLFELKDARRAHRGIAASLGIEFSPKVLRATFASIAEGLVSAYCLKRMMNHANSGDVTGTHYVRKGEAELRAAWQAVADYIEAQAADNVVPIRGGAA